MKVRTEQKSIGKLYVRNIKQNEENENMVGMITVLQCASGCQMQRYITLQHNG